MTLHVAVLGANGFIGNRLVEALHLTGQAVVRPVVRRVAGLALLSRFDLEGQVADASDEATLRTALRGCEVVVHAVAGDRNAILGTLAPTYRAAQAAGVRRLVYLSTASVHGQAPAPGTDEKSPLDNRQPLPYNNAKVQAEWLLQRLRRHGTVEVVRLRPGIVVGPRSTWITGFTEALLTGQAYLIQGGRGVCNSIYIDNLVQAIQLAMTAPAADGEAFLVGDREHVTWADLYRPIATALGYDLAQLPEALLPTGEATWHERVQVLRAAPPVRAMLSLLPRTLRRMGLAALRNWREAPVPSPWALPAHVPPMASEEMAMLYQCQYKLPFTKAARVLGYQPLVSFPEACRRTLAWLAFAGYRLADAWQQSEDKEPWPRCPWSRVS